MIKQFAVAAYFSFLLLFNANHVTHAQATSSSEVIAFWNFNDANSPGVADETIRIEHTASAGTGIVYQQRADTDGNGKGGTPFSDALLGLDESAGRSIAWDDFNKSGGDNDAELFISTSTTGYENIVFSFDVQGNNESTDPDPTSVGFNRYDIKYDTQPLEEVPAPSAPAALIVDFAGGNSTTFDNNRSIVTAPDSFNRFELDFSSIAAVNNRANFSIRLDDFRGNDDVRFDNFLITGTAIAVPEPGSMVGVVFFALAAGLKRRRRFTTLQV